MGACLYIINYNLNQWWVDCEGSAHGPFPNQVEARQSALHLARQGGDSLRPWEVLTKDEEGFFQVVGSSIYEPISAMR